MDLPAKDDLQAVRAYNARAWTHSVAEKDRWTVPVSEEEVKSAADGQPRIMLTPKTPVPLPWFPKLEGCRVLLLAGGGGQQGPLMAATGAEVTVADICGAQLEQDRITAKKFSLDVRTVECPASDLSQLDDNSFDLIINPTSSCFFPKLDPVWRECARVLVRDGRLMTGFLNPVGYQFDFEKLNRGLFELKYPQPYSDLVSLSEEEKKRFLRPESPLEYGHSLTDQMGGLIKHGFVIDGMFEDEWDHEDPIQTYFPPYIVLRARLST